MSQTYTNLGQWARPAAAVLLLVGSAQTVFAQSTDGYHAIQVFPIVVDSATFSQRFHFRAAYPWDPAWVQPVFYPAQGTARQGPLTCPGFEVYTDDGEVRFASLRELCPGLPAGSAFGTLVARSESGIVFAGSSRVSNPAGIGFAIEAFPASDFTSASTAVTGLRRLAAQVGAPAYQTNCFVGSLAELAPAGPPTATTVALTVRSSAGIKLGETTVAVQPGQIVRLLDVFAAANVPAGNVDDAVATFSAVGDARAGLISFCTVQDNTSFGADFRIGKQEWAWGGLVPGAQDNGANRWAFNSSEDPIDAEGSGAAFVIPPGATRNVHVFYFRHPDYIGCSLWDSQTNQLVTAAHGLEIRLRAHDADGWRVLAGGNGITEFYGLYLGDKGQEGEGAHTSYQLEVESNGQNEASARHYTIGCTSGSGSSRGELVRKGLPTSF